MSVVGNVESLGDHDGERALRHIDDGQGILIEAEADLATLISDIGSVVVDALGIVHVTIVSVATSEDWVQRVADVNHVQTSAA